MSSPWLSQLTTSNSLRQTYISGFLDVNYGDFINRSGNINLYKGDLSGAGRLFLAGDASLNGRLFVLGDVSINGNLRGNFPPGSIPASAIIGSVASTSTTTSSFTTDLSTNQRLFIGGDASLNGRLFVLGDVSLNGNLRANYPAGSIPSSAIIGGFTTGNFNSDISGSGRLFMSGDASLNSRLFVANDISGSGRLFISGDASLNGRLFVANDISGSGRLFLAGDVSLSGRLFINRDLSLNGSLFINKDLSLNGNLSVGNTTSSVSFYATSDYRIKNNVEPLNNTFNVDKLKPVSYTNILLNKPDVGFLAHEVQEIFSFMVNGVKDGEQTQSINYNSIIGILVKEIQDLKKQVETLRYRIDNANIP